MRQYIFAYGSLVNIGSLASTLGYYRNGIPAIVKDIKRAWISDDGRMLRLGLTKEPNYETNGILIEVDSYELSKINEREDIGLVNNLDIITHNKIITDIYIKPLDVVSYFSIGKIPIKSPIYQSYIDIVMMGFYHVSSEYLDSFIKNTYNWDKMRIENDRSSISPKLISEYKNAFNDIKHPYFHYIKMFDNLLKDL